MTGFELPRRLPTYRLRLHAHYSSGGDDLLRNLIGNSHAYVTEETSYDNWNGGTYGHDVQLFLPMEELSKVDINDIDRVTQRLSEDLNKVSASVPNEFFANVHLELFDENDEVCQRARPLNSRTERDADTLSIWTRGMVRLFISHRDEHKVVANELAEALESYGISSFVAHDSIQPMSIWQTEILNGLESMEIMLAFVTDDFHASVPEFSSPWTSHTHVTSLTLNRFTRTLATAMVEGVTGGKSLPREVLEQIIEKTDGVPLFVEELTKTILESGLLEERADRYVTTGPLDDVTIPATLHDSLMARLDRLGSVKEVAQTASAIGQEFDYDLLGAVSPLSFEKLRDALNQLIDAGLIFRRDRSDEGAYIFKHALVQDATYSSLLRRKREELHKRIAGALQERFPERVESEPELLAHHLTEARLFEPAIEQWKKAGNRAMASSANAESASHLSKALELFTQLEDAGNRPEEELSIQMPLAAAFMGARGYSAPETGKAYFRARELCQQIGDTAQMSAVSYGIWNYLAVGGQHPPALELAEECVELAEREGERTQLIAAHNNLGASLLHIGQFDKAQQHLDKAVALSDPKKDQTWWQEYGEDPTVAAPVWGSWVLWIRGYPDQALLLADRSLKASRCQGADIVTAAFAMQYVSVVRYFCGDVDGTRELAQANIDFCTENDIPLFLVYGTVMRGRSMLEEVRMTNWSAR